MNQPPVTRHTRIVRFQENLARGVIFALSGLTVLILVWILAYIFWKGLRYDNQVIHPVVNTVQQELPLVEDGVVFIVHKGVNIHDVTILDLKTLWGKPRPENWGFYSRQDLKAPLFAFAGDTPWDKSVEELLFSGTEEGTFLPHTHFVESPDEMILKVASTPGGLGYLRATDAPLAKKDHRVKIVGIRRDALVVHPDVMAPFENRQLSFLPEKMINRILSGEVKNWEEVGGPDLPVVLIDQTAELEAQINKTPGAAGLYPADTAILRGYSMLSTDRRERGWNLTLDFLLKPPARSGQWGGISWIIINTLLLILFTLIFSVPVGVAAAVFLVEYSRQNRFVALLRLGTETLAGIPSIVFGLFGYIVFIEILHLGKGFISSTLSVTLMILPTIIRTAEEALKSVPGTLREGSLAMGATRLQTVIHVVIPAAIPGIVTGIILAIGRTVGETAVLLYTLGSNMDLVRGPASSARVLSLHLYILFSEALSFDRAFSTGLVLIVIVLVVNLATSRLVGRMNRLIGRI